MLGGDFNTILGGAREEAYAAARAWAHDLQHEDPRSTHLMGRLDYLFFRGTGGWTMSTTRADERFGSDHYPVVGRFTAHRFAASRPQESRAPHASLAGFAASGLAPAALVGRASVRPSVSESSR